MQNQPGSDLVLADCVRFWPNGSGPEASRCARVVRPASGQCFPADPDRMRIRSGMFTGLRSKDVGRSLIIFLYSFLLLFLLLLVLLFCCFLLLLLFWSSSFFVRCGKFVSCRFNWVRHSSRKSSATHCYQEQRYPLLSRAALPFLSRAALPIPINICSIFVCPDNGIAASVWPIFKLT